MSLNPDSIKVGDVLYRVTREKAGNTMMSRDRVDTFTVTLIEWPEPNNPDSRQWKSGTRSLSRYRLSQYRKSPPEWLSFDLFEPRRCYFCRVDKPGPHKETCPHPAALRARKAAAKAPRP